MTGNTPLINKINAIDIVYVNYSKNTKGLGKLIFILKTLGLYSRHVIVENNPKAPLVDSNAIRGSNVLQDFSGYNEGLLQLEAHRSRSDYILFVNDTFSTHRHFGVTSYFALALKLLQLKFRKFRDGVLIGEQSGTGIGEILYKIPIKCTFSSYLFVLDTKNATHFFGNYFNIVINDVMFDGRITSSSGNISNDYLLGLNGYLGYESPSVLGSWYLAATATDDLKLLKAKCLVLERILPSFVTMSGGIFANLYSLKLLSHLRSAENRLMNIFR